MIIERNEEKTQSETELPAESVSTFSEKLFLVAVGQLRRR